MFTLETMSIVISTSVAQSSLVLSTAESAPTSGQIWPRAR